MYAQPVTVPAAAPTPRPDPEGRTVLVCGGLNYARFTLDDLDSDAQVIAYRAQRDHVRAVLDRGHAASPIGTLVTLAERGAQWVAADWARKRGVRCVAYPIAEDLAPDTIEAAEQQRAARIFATEPIAAVVQFGEPTYASALAAERASAHSVRVVTVPPADN